MKSRLLPGYFHFLAYLSDFAYFCIQNNPIMNKWLYRLLLSLLTFSTAWAVTPDDDTALTPERLFHIARSLNKNLVCYDARLDNGKLDIDDPIKVYWVNRTNRPGAIDDLSFIQRKLAYGYKVVEKGDDSCQVTLSAYPERRITIKKEGERYAGFLTINGVQARLTTLFVQLKPNSSINVDYVELQGYAVESGEPVTERIRK